MVVVVVVVVVEVVLVDVVVVDVVDVVFVDVDSEVVVVDVLVVCVVGLQIGKTGLAGLMPTGQRPGEVQLPLLEQEAQQLPHLKGGEYCPPTFAVMAFPSGKKSFPDKRMAYLHTKRIPAV